MQPPEWTALKHFEDYPLWAKALAFLATNIIACVVLAQWITSFGITGYWLIVGSIVVLSFLVLFIKAKPPILIHREGKSVDTSAKEDAKEEKRTETMQKPNQAVPAPAEKPKERTFPNLTKEEKEFVAPYIFQDITSQYMDVMSGLYRSLRQKQIAGDFAPVGYLTYRDVLLQEWAREYLNSHRELLKGFEHSMPRRKPHWH